MKIDIATDFAGPVIHNIVVDPLTRLPTRQHLLPFLEDLCLAASGTDSTDDDAALLTVALDNFSHINYSHGYETGDKVLYEISRRLESEVPSCITLARLASDEFCLVVRLQKSVAIKDICQKLCVDLRKPLAIGNLIVNVTASVGAAVLDSQYTKADDWITHALQACRLRKSSGKNGYAIYSRQMLRQHNHKLYLKHALIKALKDEKLEVYYQPIINLKTRQLEKCEALLRWNHNGNNISPTEFIPVAEEFGLAKTLGDYVWKKTCQQLVTFGRNGLKHIRVSINRSMAEFPDEEYCSQEWMNQLDQNNLSQNQISFEITETLLAPDNPGFTDYLNRLKSGGCTISLDDFGTGYSSLSYLRQFPIDYLKIDRSFIHDLEKSSATSTLVSSIIQMAKSLNIKTIAEGVETKAQLEKLKAMKCDFIQGFLFSRAIEGEAFIEFSNSFCYEKSLGI